MPFTLQEPSEYEVYDAYLTNLYGNRSAKIVVSCGTIPPDPKPSKAYIRRGLPGVRPDTLANFDRACKRRKELHREFFKCAARIQLTPQPASETYGLHSIRTDFPTGNGIVYFSCIGFSKDGRQALGSVDTFSNKSFPNAGFGWFILANFVRGAWQVVEKKMAWIA